MPGSAKGDAASPSGGANQPTNDVSHTIPLTYQTVLGVITPNPDMGKSTIDGTVDPVVNPDGADLVNTTRRSRRVRVKSKTPRTIARDSALGSHPSESIPPWFPPHFYPPWLPSPYQYPYATSPAHYLPQMDPRMTSHPSTLRQLTRFRSHVTEAQQENPENSRPVQPGEERIERNLLPNFEQARSENAERSEVQAGGGGGGGDGDDDNDEDEDWSGYNSAESEEESYVTEEDTLDTGSSAPNKSPARTQQTRRENSTSTRRNHRQRSPVRQAQATIDMAAIQDMVRKGVARELAEIGIGKGKVRDQHLGVDEGPLSKCIYRASMANFKYPTTLPNFRGSGDTQDPHNFVHNFQERLRLLGATDPIMCRVFTTCLSGEASD